MKTEVSVKKCPGYGKDAVFSSIKDAVGLLGGIERFIKKGSRVLIKPNLLTGKPPEAAVTTHPAVVSAAIRLVKEAGGVPVVGDSPGLGSVFKIAEKCGVLAVCKEEGAEFIDLKTLTVVENPQGHTFKRLEIAQEALSADCIINLPKLKTHAQMYLTLGVKNIFGCVPGKKKAQWHLAAGTDSLYFAGMMLDLYLYLKPALTIMDGVVGMEGNGPGNGDPRSLGLIAASSDCIALDTVIAEILGADPLKLPILEAARLRGFNQTSLKEIKLHGDDIREFKVKDFKFPPLISVNFAHNLPYFMDRLLRKALTSRPHIDNGACTLCSMCVNVCPADVMKKTAKIEIDYDSCIRCYCCQEICPEGAIAPRDGWLKRLIPGL